tara:strand:+ start:9021 stop:9371 length:351 start_codon:yes stop_codon:yes gene_type:complete
LENNIQAPPSDRKLVQFLLRSGLIISMLLMVAGLIVNVSTGHIESVSVGMFELLGESLSLGDRLLGIGVLVLALTPALRVLTLTALWTREKDWKFVGISVVVIIALIISVSLGGHA